MTVIFVAVLALFVGSISCELVPLKTCGVNATTDVCAIYEVRISPCSESPEACVLKKGKSASISFDYIPKFAATKLKSMVYWDNGVTDTPFSTENYDACQYTACPTVVGDRQTFTYRLKIRKLLPDGLFPIKWKLWNEDNEEEVCCFAGAIKLRK